LEVEEEEPPRRAPAPAAPAPAPRHEPPLPAVSTLTEPNYLSNASFRSPQ
jgi:hypothetical protein